jgi:CheY-like chemotaxis protein
MQLETTTMTAHRILVVDDSPVLLAATRISLEAAGYEVLGLDNPLSVPHVIRKEKPALVLLDVNMPTMSGSTVMRIVKTMVEGSRTRVVLFSNLEEPALLKEATDCGAHGWIRKSLSEPEMLQRVAAYIQS